MCTAFREGCCSGVAHELSEGAFGSILWPRGVLLKLPGSLWDDSRVALGSRWITLGSRWVTLGSLWIVSGAIVVARPLEQGRAFSPDSYSAVAVTHVRPFDRKSVRLKPVCPKRRSDCLTAGRSPVIPGTVVIVLGYALSVVYVSGNVGGGEVSLERMMNFERR